MNIQLIQTRRSYVASAKEALPALHTELQALQMRLKQLRIKKKWLNDIILSNEIIINHELNREVL